MKLITKDICYLAKRNVFSLLEYKECLEKFSSNFETEVSLENKTPIFLDTNILLRYYSISFTAREKLLAFIKENSFRIILSPQVQHEFIKNRENAIQKFFDQVTSRIPKDFNSDVVNKMNSFLEIHKTVLKDYTFVEAGIITHKEELEMLLQKLKETVELKRKEYVDLLVKDNFLDILSTCQLDEGLSEDELDSIKKDFDLMSKMVSAESIDSILNKPNAIFPGFADIKNKPDNPYGDYIIYHEMMKFMLNNKTDVIFLTFDNSKGDWMTKTKASHLHYVQNMYSNTGGLLYIFDAERTLGELLDVDIESLVKTEANIQIEVTAQTLKQLSITHSIFNGVNQKPFPQHIIKELHLNGYNSINKIEDDLNKGLIAAKEYNKSKNNILSNIGMLRAGLKIVNHSYNIRVEPDNTIIKQSEQDLQGYRKFNHLVTS